MPRARRIYLSVAAQDDNLGDIEIRQVALDMAGSGDAKLTVFVGEMSASYIAAFVFPEGARLRSSGPLFVFEVVFAILRRRAHLMIAPGPYVLARKPPQQLKAVLLLVTVIAVRLSGGAVVSAGRAVRGRGRLAQRVQRRIVRACTLFVARDTVTSDVLGLGIRAAPDVALLHTRPDSEGDRVVLSFRGDSGVDTEWFASLVGSIRSAGGSPLLVSQVRRDDPQHLALAAEHGIDVVAWETRTHVDQLRRVRNAFAESTAVVSNRLHAVIFGLQSGVSPVVVVRSDPDKILTTLERTVPLQKIWTDDSSIDVVWKLDPADQAMLMLRLKEARAQLSLLGKEIETAFNSSTTATTETRTT